jgi:hypothetical protein
MKTHQRELHEYISDISGHADVRLGSPLPLGTQKRCGGVNFAIFSRHASRVQLELFDHPEDAVPVRVIDLDSARNRTGDVWHVWIEGIGPGQLYAYRMDGPYEPGQGGHLALDIARVPTEQIIYIENNLMFAQIAEGLWIPSILHTDYPSTCAQLASFGLQHDEGVSHEIR